MPWKVFKENNQFYVYKLTTDDKKGEKVGCHSSETDAHEQLGAFYASESKKNLEIECSLISSKDIGSNKMPISTSGDQIAPVESGGMVKGMSLSQIGDLLWLSFKAQFDDYYNMWFHEIFDEDSYVIISWHTKLFKATYTRTDDKAIFQEIKEWEEVKRKTEYVSTETPSDDMDMGEDENLVKSCGVVKAIDENTIGGYAVIWGSEHKKDLSGEWFSKDETKELLAVHKSVGALPFFFEHTTDKIVKSTVVASIDEMGEDEVGIWYKAKIKEHELYKKLVAPLITAKSLYSSSGTFPYAKEKDKDTGMIKRWPIGEVSGTVKPMDHHQLEDGQIEEYRKAVGLISDKSENIVKFLNSTNDDEQGGEEPHQNHAADILKNLVISKHRLAEYRLSTLMEEK